MRKIVSVLTLLLVLWTLCGCSAFTSAGPSEEGEGSSAIEAAAPVEPSAPSSSPMPTPKPEPVTVAGQVVRASKSVFELRLEDGSALTVVLTDETQVTGDALLDGCQAAVTYDKSARTMDTVPALAVELTAPEEKTAPTPEELLSSMTLEEKVGQLFFVRVPKEEAAEVAARYQFGGYILFGRDFADKTRDQVRGDIQSYQDSVGVPMFIGVDEEGGTVVRVSSNPALCPEPYLSPRQLYEQGGLDLAAGVEQEKKGMQMTAPVSGSGRRGSMRSPRPSTRAVPPSTQKGTSEPTRAAISRRPSAVKGRPQRELSARSTAAASAEPPPRPAQTGMRFSILM